ncbi:transposable element Tcb2 transposase [Trichonephila clavipes]|nr:transposable element Tcb2 transposase [Trichonephila clavipes]
MSFTRRPGSGRPRQTSHRENRHIVIKARVQPNVSSTAIQAQVVPSLKATASSRTIWRLLAKGHLRQLSALDAQPSTPPFGVVPRTKKLDCSGMEPCRP